MNRMLALAALLAVAPAFAQTSTIQAQSSGTTQAQTAKEQANSSSSSSSSSLGTTSNSLGATIGTKPVCTPSSMALTDCVSQPVSGVSNPVVTNSLDATGTFSTQAPLVTPLDQTVDPRNAGGVSANGTTK
jgi:Tfp pilus assembly protein PilV